MRDLNPHLAPHSLGNLLYGRPIDMGQNWVEVGVPFILGYLGPHRTQSRLGRGLPPYQVVS